MSGAYDGTFQKDIADQCKKVATGELTVAYPFSPKDWRHDALAMLLWDAGEEIERLRVMAGAISAGPSLSDIKAKIAG